MTAFVTNLLGRRLKAAEREIERLRAQLAEAEDALRVALDYAAHASHCPRATTREIKYQQPLVDRLPCRCGLEEIGGRDERSS